MEKGGIILNPKNVIQVLQSIKEPLLKNILFKVCEPKQYDNPATNIAMVIDYGFTWRECKIKLPWGLIKDEFEQKGYSFILEDYFLNSIGCDRLIYDTIIVKKGSLYKIISNNSDEADVYELNRDKAFTIVKADVSRLVRCQDLIFSNYYFSPEVINNSKLWKSRKLSISHIPF